MDAKDATDGAVDDLDGLAALAERLTTAAFTLAAVVGALAHAQADPDVVLTDERGEVLAASGLARPRQEGGWRLAPVLADLARSAAAPATRLLVPLQDAAAAAQGRGGWAEHDLATKIALGRSSGMGGRVMMTEFVPHLGDLADRLAAPSAAALDVGVGVGEMAVAWAQTQPFLRVVGIDIAEDVLAVARATVAERGLRDRVEIRRQDVAMLAEVEAFEMAWLPATYLSQDDVIKALPRLYTALRPGGWLIAGARWSAWTRAGGSRRGVADCLGGDVFLDRDRGRTSTPRGRVRPDPRDATTPPRARDHRGTPPRLTTPDNCSRCCVLPLVRRPL
jgi:SAM-dependent methyltransferase